MDVRFREAKRRARELRDEFCERGEFNHRMQFLPALRDRLRDLESAAYDAFVDKIAEDVDRESIRDRDDAGPTLPGLNFDLDGEYRCGESTRIAKKLAMIEHAERAITIIQNNLSKVMASAIRHQDELTCLRPYWGSGMTKAQAVEAYRAATEEEAG